MIHRFTFIAWAISILLSCNNNATRYPQQSIYLFKDKDGLYQYNFERNKDLLIFKIDSNQIFLEEPLKILFDTLTVGVKGKNTSPTYIKTYYSISLKTGYTGISKKIIYEGLNCDTLNVQTFSIDKVGKITLLKDTSMPNHSSNSYKGVKFNQSEPRFFSKHTIGNKSVISLNGNIYLVQYPDTTLIVKYEGHFDMKFGTGYFDPQLDPKSEYVIFSYVPAFTNFSREISLQKVNIKTKVVSTLMKGVFLDPAFSMDGSTLLFKRNERQNINDTWICDIFILNLKTKKETKISEAYSAAWSID